MTRAGLRDNALVVLMVGNEVGIFFSCSVRGFWWPGNGIPH